MNNIMSMIINQSYGLFSIIILLQTLIFCTLQYIHQLNNESAYPDSQSDIRIGTFLMTF